MSFEYTGPIRHDAEDSQRQSPFFQRFPREVRDAIYLELWRTGGLVQHVFWHQEYQQHSPRKFCLWPCTTPFDVEGTTEKQLDEVWEREGRCSTIYDPLWHDRLASHWYNHWPCEEDMIATGEQAGFEVERSTERLNCPCSVNRELPPKQPFLPSLLTCKRMYFECIKSIYESLTFVFAAQPNMDDLLIPFYGRDVATRPLMPFARHIRNLEISLPITFPRYIPCCSTTSRMASGEGPHLQYDFHWLQLSAMDNCRKVCIWIDACPRIFCFPDNGSIGNYHIDSRGYTPITKTDVAVLAESIFKLGEQNANCHVTITAPLNAEIVPESGYVESPKLHSRVELWKRHSGDKFHPWRNRAELYISPRQSVVHVNYVGRQPPFARFMGMRPVPNVVS